MLRTSVIGCLGLALAGCVAGRGGVVTKDGEVVHRDASAQYRDGSSGRRDGSQPGLDGSLPHRDGSTNPFDGSTTHSDGGVIDRDGSMPGDGSTGTGLPETSCADGWDDNYNGLTDCADPDCNGLTCSAGGATCASSICGCTGAARETNCGDGGDEDCDGMVDCADPDCEGATCGTGSGVTCSGGACPCPDGLYETECGDGADGDCDGMTDCADPDCVGHICTTEGFTCTPTMMCACPGMFEFCNGIDENCNGVIDDGCPRSLSPGSPMSVGSFGVGGGSAFSDPCPAGTVLMGMSGRVGALIDQLQPICAALVMQTDMSGRPEYRYPVHRGAAIVGATHGGTGGTAFDDRCAGDDVVIGVTAHVDDMSNSLRGIQLHCGTVSVGRPGPPAPWTVTVTPSSDLPVRGTGGTTSTPANCMTGALSGLDEQADTLVQRVSFSCAQLQLQTL